MTPHRCLVLALAATVVLTLSSVADAGIIYDNISPSTGATSGGSASISSSDHGPLADSFSTGAGFSVLTDLKLLVAATTPTDGDSFNVLLLSDTSTSPGSVLTTLRTVSDSSLTTTLSTVDIILSTPYLLAANTRYWIELSSPSTSGVWSFTTTNVGIGVANEYNFYAGSVSANSAFTPYQMTVTTSAVPEPSSFGLCAIGIAALAIARRHLGRTSKRKMI